MGEQKRRVAAAEHLPPEGMVSASGPRLTKLVRLVAAAMADAVDRDHLDVPIAAACALAAAVDFLRANAGDAFTREIIRAMLDQRLSKPLEYWGVSIDPSPPPAEPSSETRQ